MTVSVLNFDLSPAEVLLRLRAAGLSGIVLLESLGPITDYGAHSFLSAEPTSMQHHLPEFEPLDGLANECQYFPAWLGGLKYEAASSFGLSSHAASSETQFWGWYPSGLVWHRAEQHLELVGEPHLDWSGVLHAELPASKPQLTVGAFTADDLDFPSGVLAVQQLIRAGEVYQVNLSRGVTAQASGDPLAAYLRLRDLNPSPFMAYAELGSEVVVSGSPERLVRWQRAEQRLSARPIAGTRRRGDTHAEDATFEAELRSSVKERAEHVMLVDLIRHDLGAVAAAASVWVPELMLVERYSHVMHLVSEVAATTRDDVTLCQVIAATFPGGTITGAPKRRVMEAITELEPSQRGWYTGSLGRISREGADFNILIRTASFRPATDQVGHWTTEVRAGAGVVIGSDAQAETREALYKAQATLAALGGAGGRPAQAAAPPSSGTNWTPSLVLPNQFSGMRVLLLDNFDSFTHNLAHDLQALGAAVLWQGQTAELAALLALNADAVLIGPGPGTPQSSGVTLALARACLARRIPLLGVCLGHQALGEVLGARVARAARPVHGEVAQVYHGGDGLFEGLPSPTAFARYHSLVVRDLPPVLGRVTARSEDGEIMALEALAAPAWGVQFHPESLLSKQGRAVLGRWLKLSQSAGTVIKVEQK